MSRGQGRVYRPKVRGRETALWWLDYSAGGRRHREPSGTANKTEAQKLLRQRLGARESGRLVGPSPDRVTLADLHALAVQQMQLDGRRSLWRVELLWRHLDRILEPATRVLDITVPLVDAFAVQRRGEGASPAEVNRELGALRRGFRLAVQKGLLAARPEFSLLEEDNARTGFFEEADFRALLAELPADLRPVMQFAYLTGWRIHDEVLTLTWAQVDLDAGVVRLDVGSTKNGDGRTFPFQALPELAAVLRAQRARTDMLQRATGQIILHVFHRRGRRIKDFYEAWHAACRRAAAEVRDGIEVLVRPQLLGRIPHDFRRTAVRNLERAGVPRSVAMQLTGHKTEAIYRRYAIVAERDLAEGVAKLAQLHHPNGKQAANNPAPGRRRHALSSGAA